jgi:cytochrome c
MKKFAVIFLLSPLAFACGGSNDNKAGQAKDSSSSGADAAASATPSLANQKGLELIGSSDCTTCHDLRTKKIGPAYSDVAEKYKNMPHAMDTLIDKVINGGSGNWGTIPMTAHKALKQEDVKEMVAYILTLKK